MFDAPGRKIQELARIYFFFSATIKIILGGYMIFLCFNKEFGTFGLPILFAGIFAIIFGVLISWIISLLLYGFGELIDDTEEIRSITEELYDETHVKASKVSSKAERQ